MLFKVEVNEEGRIKSYTIEANNRKEAKLKVKKARKIKERKTIRFLPLIRSVPS